LEDPENEDNWLSCLPPRGFEWKLPAGKITPVVGDPIYVTASGAYRSREEYIAQYGLDPEVALTMMRAMKKTVRDSVNTANEMTTPEEDLPSSIKRLLQRLQRA
jgi:hypothetical protein